MAGGPLVCGLRLARTGFGCIDNVLPRTPSERVWAGRLAHVNWTPCELSHRRSFPSNAYIPDVSLVTAENALQH